MVFGLTPLQIFGLILIFEGMDEFFVDFGPFDKFFIKHFFALWLGITVILHPAEITSNFLLFVGIYFLWWFPIRVGGLLKDAAIIPFNYLGVMKLVIGVIALVFPH